MGRQLPHEAAKSSWGGMPKWLNSAVSHILQTAPWASYRPMGVLPPHGYAGVPPKSNKKRRPAVAGSPLLGILLKPQENKCSVIRPM